MKEIIDYAGHLFKLMSFIDANKKCEWNYYICKYCKVKFNIWEIEDFIGKYSKLKILQKYKCIPDEEKLIKYFEINNN